MEEKIRQRIEELKREQAGVAKNIAAIEQELMRLQHLYSSYNGAIGELSALLAPTTVDDVAQ